MSENPLDRAIEELRRWADWSQRVGRFTVEQLPYEHMVADVIEAYGESLQPTDGGWFPILSLPEGRHVLLYWPDGERGVGGIECATVFYDENGWSYWTHGGPNAGSDWSPRGDEKPTYWKPIEPPK